MIQAAFRLPKAKEEIQTSQERTEARMDSSGYHCLYSTACMPFLTLLCYVIPNRLGALYPFYTFVNLVLKHLVENQFTVHIVTNMGSRFSAMLVLRLERELYRGKYGMIGSSQAWTPDLGEHFDDFATNLATLPIK
ncbi:hypothetical protein AVEN_129219-1 [Araneus ventricosus]|uniref:Uncharacterized protein n=1 Tax=Araneus ventricosus TaxID=182803 RepID=A0A4Y2HH44_ARAVE|nr:hypothetical protein AVEN_129219-1 [Araneus ventricosus]